MELMQRQPAPVGYGSDEQRNSGGDLLIAQQVDELDDCFAVTVSARRN
jgi:hypothetical protein